jgi:hypothetical protein
MGYSTAFTFFGGCAELLPAVFLLFRRTALLGSLLAFAVMLNIVMLNFCYDVPVKLYSLNLLLLSMFLILLRPKLQRTHHFVSEYRCVRRQELSDAIRSVGFPEPIWLMPAESGYYQPLILARWP